MNLNTIKQAFYASKLALKANAPTIMVIGGVSSMTVGAVWACKKTLDLDEILEQHVYDLQRIEDSANLSKYSPEQAKSDTIKVRTRIALDLGKNYALPIVCFVAGTALVFGGHRIMLKRNATLALAYTSLQKTFDAYRKTTKNFAGSEIEPDLRMRALDQVESDEEDFVDPYNRVFESGASESWQPDLSANRLFLTHQQKFAQHLLIARGHLYLSEVYKSIGFEESDISRVVGWKVRTLPDGTKDIPMVDFGLDAPQPLDDLLAQEKAIYLDFNCQGLIVGGKVQKALEKS